VIANLAVFISFEEGECDENPLVWSIVGVAIGLVIVGVLGGIALWYSVRLRRKNRRKKAISTLKTTIQS